MRLRAILALALALVLEGCGSLERRVSREMLVPRSDWLAEPDDLGLAFEEFRLPTGDDLEVHGWFVPAVGERHGTVVLCHGNAANISYYHPYLAFLHDAGLDVVLFDYRGYGRSTGEVSVDALFTDTEAVLAHVRARDDVDPDRVALFGASLGSIVALRTAARHPEVAAVVVEDVASPHAALTRALGGRATARLVEWFVLPGGLEPRDNAARYTGPILFVTGEYEPTRVEHLAAFERAAGPAQCWVLPRTGHAPDGLLEHDGEYQAQVARFLVDALAGRPNRLGPVRVVGPPGEREVDVAVLDEDGTHVEFALVDAAGDVTYLRTRSSGGRARARVTGEFRFVAAAAYDRVVEADDGSWTEVPGPLTIAEDQRLQLVNLAGIVRESLHPLPTARVFAEEVARMERESGPLHPLLATELCRAWLDVGRVLFTSDEPTDREAGRALLRRCIASEPAHPELHYWPAARYTAGFHDQAAVDAARTLLEAP
ncbi:MAG: alpha/beta fold hydrolase [Planctomycetota bacterium]